MLLRRALLAIPCVLLASTAALVAAPTAQAASSVTLVGHGWGHGRGMGQWGAYGYAVDQGWTSAMILDHYYGGTAAGTVPNDTMSVRLISLDGSAGSWFTAGQDFTVGGTLVGAGSAARVVQSGSTWQLFTSYGGCSAPNNYGPYPLSGPPVVRTAADPANAVANMLTVCANGTSYRGALRFVDDGGARIVNDVPLESYLLGVVPRESPASWADARGGRGLEALKAQAVAARSYAMAENRWPYAKTCDTTSCQVYGGAGVSGRSTEDPRSNAAVAQTAGVVRVTGSGAVARTEFSASTGGWTAGGAFPAVQDLGDSRSPNHTWTATLSGPAVTAAYPAIGNFVDVRVTSSNGLGFGGGRAIRVSVIGTSSTVSVAGASFASAMGLKSDWFFPVSQAASVSYVKHSYSDTVYRSMSYAGWTEHSAVSWTDYQASGFPSVASMPFDTVKYPWSSALYAVTFWPSEPEWQWDALTYDLWQRAGYPGPRNAGYIYGTMFYRDGAAPTIYAQAPDNSVHPLTYAEWAAAGYPWPVDR